MKYYKIKAMKYGKNRVMYIPDFEDESKRLLADFLSDDYMLLSDEIQDALERVFSLTDNKIELAGNTCIITIDRENCFLETTIDEIDVGPACSIRTEDFKSVISDWENDVQTLKKIVLE